MAGFDLNAGALAPVAIETETFNLTVEGAIPESLNGTLIRNGPNPFNAQFKGNEVLDWWPEAAMLHGITLHNGKATSYRNRWVRTQNWAEFHEHPYPQDFVNSNPNVAVIAHGDELLALAEGGVPVAFNRNLEGMGPSTTHAALMQGTCAHPKIDPTTKELMYFRSDWSQPWLRYGVLDRAGQPLVDMEIDVAAPAMMHDMAITSRYSILFDLNVGYDFSMFDRGYRIPICWQDTRTSQLAVVPRHGGPVRWLEIEPCFIQHVVNAWDTEEDQITLDVVRYPWYLKKDPESQTFLPNPLGVLWRYHINLNNGQVSEQQLDELNIELPRINEAYTGLMNRYVYAAEQPSDDLMQGVIRYELNTSEVQKHAVSGADQNSEPIFVPHPHGTTEDQGWVLVSVYKADTHTNEIRILNAQDISAEPIARIHLGHRIPAGFHGAWVPDV